MGFAKPIEQYLFGNLLSKIHGFMYLKDIIRVRHIYGHSENFIRAAEEYERFGRI